MDILLFSYIAIAILLIGGSGYWISLRVKHKYLLKSLTLRPLLIKLAKKNKEDAKDDPLKELNLTSQLLSSMSNLKIPFSLESAVHNIGEEIHFYVCVPKDSPRNETPGSVAGHQVPPIGTD